MRRVPNVPAVETLLTAKPSAELARVGHAYCKLVLAFDEQIGDVQREGNVSTDVRAGKLAIHAHGACVIDSLEMQEQPFAAIERRRLEGAPVPQQSIGLQLTAGARQGGFGRKWDDDVGFECIWRGLWGIAHNGFQIAVGFVVACQEGTLPTSVEHLVRGARKLRIGMFFKHVIGIERFAPGREQRRKFAYLVLFRLCAEHLLQMQHLAP